jgi:Fe-S cluster biogenesis protein NfuA
MPATLDAKEFQAELRRLDTLLQESARIADPAAQAHVRALVQAVLGLHGAGLERILAHLDEAALDACVRDEIVGGLLLLHGLHPLELRERVSEALEQMRPTLQLHGCAVELIDFDDGVVRLRVEGGSVSSAAAIREGIEEAITAKAPDAVAVEIDGLAAIPMTEDDPARIPMQLV